MLGGGSLHGSIFYDVISVKNLFSAWNEFKRGKRNKIEVQEFEFNLENNLFQLHEELKSGKWKPEGYTAFYVRDPKLRHIHKASVRDRVFNQALFRVLYQIFDKHFIHDSYSCRSGKGTHRGVLQLDSFIRSLSKNYTKPVFILKCDVRKFFDSISHEILLSLIRRHVSDCQLIHVIELIIHSFCVLPGKGLPLGNVTSQLFANVYLNELDHFMKHVLKTRRYLRYCDDFVIVEREEEKLVAFIPAVDSFLRQKLGMNLHPNKIILRKATQGIDFLGYVLMPHYKVLRTKTKKRIVRKIKILREDVRLRKIEQKTLDITLQSYLGMLEHCKGYTIRKKLLIL